MTYECTKRGYSKKDAQTMKNLREKSHNGRRLRIYQCPSFNHRGLWHLTHILNHD